jgi:hypothetical protein
VSGLYDIGDQFVPPIPDGWINVGSSQKNFEDAMSKTFRSLRLAVTTSRLVVGKKAATGLS